MLGCASWDHWCPYQTPYTTTIPKAVRTLVLYCRKNHVDFFRAIADIRPTMSGLRSQLSRIFQREEETDEVMDLKLLCWMLENASRGPPLLRVARHISSICRRSPQDQQRKWIMASHPSHFSRLHETFWYLLTKIKWTSRNNPTNANDCIEMLEHLSILGSAIICTSPQWTDGLHPLSRRQWQTFFKHRLSQRSTGQKIQCAGKVSHYILTVLPEFLTLALLETLPFLYLQVSFGNDGKATYYYYDT